MQHLRVSPPVVVMQLSHNLKHLSAVQPVLAAAAIAKPELQSPARPKFKVTQTLGALLRLPGIPVTSILHKEVQQSLLLQVIGTATQLCLPKASAVRELRIAAANLAVCQDSSPEVLALALQHTSQNLLTLALKLARKIKAAAQCLMMITTMPKHAALWILRI